MRNLEADNLSLTSKVAEGAKAFDAKSADCTLKETERERLATKLKTCQDEREALRSEVERLEAASQVLKQIHQAELKAAETARRELENVITQTEKSRDDLKKSVGASEVREQKMQGEVTKLEGEKASLQEDVKHQQTQMKISLEASEFEIRNLQQEMRQKSNLHALLLVIGVAVHGAQDRPLVQHDLFCICTLTPTGHKS